MKQTKIFIIMILALMVSTVCFATSYPIPAEKLPQTAKEFVKKQFAGAKIVYAEKEVDAYGCKLDNGLEIEFNLKGEWIKIDGSVRTTVPASVIPDAINKYVKDHHPKAGITEIEKGRYGYKVELSNKYKMKFKHNGEFIGKNH